VDPRYIALAADVGRALAAINARVVYGGASVGMMGAVAEAAMAAGGRVVGVIPAALDAREIAHRGITELRVVDTMHTRKKTMADESDAFVALPGGFGTLDELFEITTWRQIDLHHKPIAVFNAGGYFDPLLAFVERAVAERFVPPNVANVLDVVSDLEQFVAWVGRVPARPEDVR
jgi:uncharacterized protein (TIGR00730 family)